MSKIYELIMKQHTIDKGQFGGLIAIFSSSLIILAPFSFIGILALNYDRYIKHWLDLTTFITISLVLFIIYEWIFFVIIYPSMIQFGNRQTYIHENPIKKDIEELQKTLARIEIQLKR